MHYITNRVLPQRNKAIRLPSPFLKRSLVVLKLHIQLMSTKLRASCDACHHAKIKCIKTEHGCQRCGGSGERCSYSPALPRVYQKRRSRKPVSQETQQLLSPSDSRDSPYSADPLMSHNTFDKLGTTSASIGPTLDDQAYDITGHGAGGTFWPFLPESSNLSGGLSEYEHYTPDLWSNDATPSPLTGSVPTPVSLTAPASAELSLPSVLSPSTMQSELSRERETYNLHHGIPSAQSRTRDHTEPCVCFPRLLAAMQRVSIHANVGSPALDTVLCANRTASKHCFATLQCSSAVASTMNISCTSISCGLLDRILISYQAALHNFCACLNDKKEVDSNLYEDDEEGGAPEQDTIQLKLGAFAMEKSEQIRCARGIVAREIERVRESLKSLRGDNQSIRKILSAHLIEHCTILINEMTN